MTMKPRTKLEQMAEEYSRVEAPTGEGSYIDRQFYEAYLAGFKAAREMAIKRAALYGMAPIIEQIGEEPADE